MSSPTLLAVSHGSADPAAMAAIKTLARQVSRLAPVLNVRVAFLSHAEPSLSGELAAAGRDTVIVPLLLSPGYHLSTDIASAARAAGVRVAGPLGPDPLLTTALAARLAEAGVPAGTPVVLGAAGSAAPAAADEVRRQAALLGELLGVQVLAAFAAVGDPSVPAAVSELRTRTGGKVAIASYLLAPGHFHDQLSQAGADWVTEPLSGQPALAGLVIDRYRTAARAS
jgi:sirohydrochlorin ferrochelatase